MASGGKQQHGPANRRRAQGQAKAPAAQRAPGAKSGASTPKRAASPVNTTATAKTTTTTATANGAASPARRPGTTAVATRPAPRPESGATRPTSATKPSATKPVATKPSVTTKRIAEQPNYRSRMNQRKRTRQQQRRILGAVAAVLVVAGFGWLLVSHLPSSAKGNNGAKAAKGAATAHVTAAATPAATATTQVCAPVSVLGLNGTPSKPNGPPTITGTLVNGPQCLQYVDIKPGSGTAIKAGDSATVNYTLWLSTGQKVQSSLDSGGSPFQVQNIGQASVIKGWNLGLIGMKVGGERELIIPPSLGYGAGGQPPSIPGDETLIFDVSVVSMP